MGENNRTFLHVLSLSSIHTFTYFNPTANWEGELQHSRHVTWPAPGHTKQ